VKWLVYTLLIVNFALYIAEDWNRAVQVLDSDANFLDWTAGFATSIDESAWFLLLFMFELETYVLDDSDWTGWIAYVVRGIRLVCYTMLAHTVYAFGVFAIGLYPTQPVDDAARLCDLVDAEISYVYNVEYTPVTEQTCGELSAASQFYWIDQGTAVTDKAGLKLERTLAWVDLVEVVVWLLILLAIETEVYLQDRGVTGGAALRMATGTGYLLYLLLIAFAIYWATLSHWLYFWDELLWIGGFAAIEMNVSEWRDELLEKDTEAHGFR